MTPSRLLKTCTSFRRGILGKRTSQNMCVAVTHPLHTYLELCGVITTITDVDFEIGGNEYGHTFLTLANGNIIDATADQFKGANLLPVYIGPMPEIYKRWMGCDEMNEAIPSANPEHPAGSLSDSGKGK